MISSLYAPVCTRRVCAVYIAAIKSMLGWRIVCLCAWNCDCECLFACGRLKGDTDLGLDRVILALPSSVVKKKEQNLLCTLYVQTLSCGFAHCNASLAI